jgi:hypothetical protein
LRPRHTQMIMRAICSRLRLIVNRPATVMPRYMWSQASVPALSGRTSSRYTFLPRKGEGRRGSNRALNPAESSTRFWGCSLPKTASCKGNPGNYRWSDREFISAQPHHLDPQPPDP